MQKQKELLEKYKKQPISDESEHLPYGQCSAVIRLNNNMIKLFCQMKFSRIINKRIYQIWRQV